MGERPDQASWVDVGNGRCAGRSIAGSLTARLVRSCYRGTKYRVLDVQFAFVRFQPRLALCLGGRSARRQHSARLLRASALMTRAVNLDLPARPRILVITLRRLGDVLLTTPLVRSIRRGFPDACLEMLVFRGSDAILAGNPDIDRVLTMAERPSFGETVSLARAVFRRYDLAVSTQAGDRPTFLALLAGRWRIGVVPPVGETGARWKHQVHHVPITPEPDTHRVMQLMTLAA